MKLGIIQASSQKSKNSILEALVKEVLPSKEYEIVNFGIYEEDTMNLSYLHIALCISMLLESHAVDFMITGCSSGQGMMLACNSLPGVLCGYVENVTDAYLFGRINNGNAISYPLGLNWGWTAEINFKETIKSLFCEPLGGGYPPQDAKRKKQDAEQLKQMNRLCKKKLVDVLPLFNQEFVQKVVNYDTVYQYIIKNGQDLELIERMKRYRHS